MKQINISNSNLFKNNHFRIKISLLIIQINHHLMHCLKKMGRVYNNIILKIRKRKEKWKNKARAKNYIILNSKML